jgi:ABC-type oligopeptide transport system substrate-binding subunit/DNA-binding SARP family transcriptional activator
MDFKISILGLANITLKGKQLRLRTLKGQALLFYLLAESLDNPCASRSREFLMELLWPGLPLKSAQESLRQVVYQLRKHFSGSDYKGPDILISDRHMVALNPKFAYELDADRFTRLQIAPSGENQDAEKKRLLEAASLYRGDFLSDFFLPDSAAFETWVETKRENFRRMALSVFNRLGEINLKVGNFKEVEAYAYRQVELDRFNEDGQRQLLLSLAGQGDQARIFASYAKYRNLLMSELGLEPGIELSSLLEQIRRHFATQVVPYEPIKMKTSPFQLVMKGKRYTGENGKKTLFLGKEKELDFLHRRLDDALEKHAQVAVVTGEAGAGKTALLDEFTYQAQERVPGLMAARGACNALTGAGDAYLPFRDVLEQLGQTDIGMARSNRSGSYDRELLFEEFSQALLAMANHTPLLIVLDDLQWADSASLQLLFHLARRMGTSPIFILLAYRPSEVKLGVQPAAGGLESIRLLEKVLNELKRQFGEIQLDLDVFSLAEARGFVDAFLDQDPSISPNSFSDEFRTRLFWKTKGHPLYTIELIHEMQVRGNLVKDSSGHWSEGRDLSWDLLPARIEAIIQQRFTRLGTDMQEILSAACVEGEEFTAQIIARLAGIEERKALRILTQELEQHQRLVRYVGEIQLGPVRLDRFSFRHALFQDYLYQNLNSGEQRLLHSEIAGIFEEISLSSSSDLSVQLAHHFDRAGIGGKAAVYLLKAGDRARNLYAHEEAVRHYLRAIEILIESGDEKSAASALMKLGMTYHTAFDFDAARKTYQKGFQLWRTGVTQRNWVNVLPAPHPLRLCWGNPDTLDPSLGGVSLSAPIVTQVFSGLVAPNPEMEVVPDIAADWEMLEGGRKYVFHLRQDVFWSDGKRVTAGDFEFTFKRALNPDTKSPVSSLLLYGVRGARDYHQGKSSNPDQIGIYCTNDATLVIELEEPVSFFLQQLSYYVMLPVPRHIVEKHGNAWVEPENIVTNGPFRLAKWKKDKYMLLERYPDYHGQYSGNILQVMVHLGISNEKEFKMYEVGQLDLVTNWFIPSIMFESAARKNRPDYFSGESFVTIYLMINPSHTPFSDKRVRQALALSLNLQNMAETIFNNRQSAASGGLVPRGMPGHVEFAEPLYQPETARQLLAKAGYPEGFGFQGIELAVYPHRHEMANFMVRNWQESLKIHIPVKILDNINSIEDKDTQKPPLLLVGWWADYADPENFLRVCVSIDLPNWINPHYASLLEKASHTFDQAERMTVYQEADRLLIEEAVIVPLVYMNEQRLIKPWVKNFQTMKIKHPGFWKDVVIEPHD